MKQRSVQEQKKFHSRLILHFAVSCAILFGLSLLATVSLAVFFVLSADEFTLRNIGWLYLTFFLAVLFGLGMYFLFRARIKQRTEQSSIAPFFSEEAFLYPESHFEKDVDKLSRIGRDERQGCLAAVSIKGLGSNLLSLVGPEEVKEINTILYRALEERFSDFEEYRYGFSFLDIFLIYSTSNDPNDLSRELHLLDEEVNHRVAVRGKIPSVILLGGAYVLQKGDEIEPSVEKAITASRGSSGAGWSSELIVYSEDALGKEEGEKDLPAEILRGMKEEQFQIFYQPKFDLHTNKFYGAEALVRWTHPTRGFLPPSFFIPFSEKTGLIVQLDHYIYEHALKDLSRWGAEGKRQVKVSINLSRTTVYDKGLVEFLDNQKGRYAVPSSLLDIEITESIAARDSAFLFHLVSKIKNLGIATSIDDFGCGYSSFASLKKLPFDTLKIDKSFVDDIEVDEKSRGIVKGIIEVAHALGMWTVAEGVETAGQVAILKKMGLDAIQGYYYSRPLNAFEFQRFLATNEFEKKGVSLR